MFLFGKKNSKNIKKIQISKPLPNFKKPKNFSVSMENIYLNLYQGKNYVIGKSNESFILKNKRSQYTTLDL